MVRVAVGVPVQAMQGLRPNTPVASDDRHGGTTALETRAATLARQALDLQQRGTATKGVRSRLYGLAVAFTSSAMWAATDGQRLDIAQGGRGRLGSASGLISCAGGPESVRSASWSWRPRSVRSTALPWWAR
ncbi:hypothetical protein [Streptomyces sp. NPDC053048]|uniref:hypothetical protein n=1 Tax=Streptomyces sp. NPDC053048 TaxID=3365694 RepID=UPI0037D2B527